MNIFFYCTFDNQEQWLKTLKKYFKGHKILTIDDNFNLHKIDVAIVWNIPNIILKKLLNIKIIFSLGAGVDHILKLKNYNGTPIIRIKDQNMRNRMFNHVLSQVLYYQLKLSAYKSSQNRKIWLDAQDTKLNNNITIGILGLGYIGEYVAKELGKLNYQIIGFKKSSKMLKTNFKIFTGRKLEHFISTSDIIISMLPSTNETSNFIDKKFLKKMKKRSLLINIGRGASLNEKDLIDHIANEKNFYASLDVFKNEPLIKTHKFWKNSNITITPHIAAITDVESSINYIHKKFLLFSKKNKITSDVNFKKGY